METSATRNARNICLAIFAAREAVLWLPASSLVLDLQKLPWRFEAGTADCGDFRRFVFPRHNNSAHATTKRPEIQVAELIDQHTMAWRKHYERLIQVR